MTSPSIAWRSWPIREDPLRKAFFFPLVLAAIAVYLRAALGVPAAVVGTVLVGASLRLYWLPTDYALDAEGVEIRAPGWSRRTRWRDLARAEPRDLGVFLSPFAAPSRLDPFRGLFLRCPDRHDEVLEYALGALKRARDAVH